MIDTIGYGGPTPLAIILWFKDGEGYCKTVCYEESDVIEVYKRHCTPGDLYNTLIPSIHYINN